jgi:hypothetical protein
VARRRVLEVPPHIVPFQRTPAQWADLGAPAWVYELDAGAQALVAWAVPRAGGGTDPTDRLLRWMVTQLWWPGCVQPQYLGHAGSLTDVERAMWATPGPSTHGRPDRCAAARLRADAPVPAWLECCRHAPGPARTGPTPTSRGH